MWHVWRKKETHAGLWWEYPKETDYLKETGWETMEWSNLAQNRD
jgi:hypothetical protein